MEGPGVMLGPFACASAGSGRTPLLPPPPDEKHLIRFRIDRREAVFLLHCAAGRRIMGCNAGNQAAPASRASRPDTLKKRKPPPVRTGRGLRLECDRTKDHAAVNTTPTAREQSKHREAPRVKSS